MAGRPHGTAGSRGRLEHGASVRGTCRAARTMAELMATKRMATPQKARVAMLMARLKLNHVMACATGRGQGGD